MTLVYWIAAVSSGPTGGVVNDKVVQLLTLYSTANP